MTTLRLDIAGLWFKPPAARIVNVLPHGTELEICAEPNNPVDPNAIAVHLPVHKLSLIAETDGRKLNQLSQDIYACFHTGDWLNKAAFEGKVIQAETYDDFYYLDTFQLGYLPAKEAVNLSIPRPILGILRWRDPENTRQKPKAQAEFHYYDE